MKAIKSCALVFIGLFLFIGAFKTGEPVRAGEDILIYTGLNKVRSSTDVRFQFNLFDMDGIIESTADDDFIAKRQDSGRLSIMETKGIDSGEYLLIVTATSKNKNNFRQTHYSYVFIE